MDNMIDSFNEIREIISSRGCILARAWFNARNNGAAGKIDDGTAELDHVKTSLSNMRSVVNTVHLIQKNICPTCNCGCSPNKRISYNVNIAVAVILDEEKFNGVLRKVRAGYFSPINVVKLEDNV